MYFLSYSQEQAQCIHEREPGDVVTSPTAQARAGCSPQTGALPQPGPFPLGPLCWEVSLPSSLGRVLYHLLLGGPHSLVLFLPTS